MIYDFQIDGLDDSLNYITVTKLIKLGNSGYKPVEIDSFERYNGSGSKSLWINSKGNLVDNEEVAKKLTRYEDKYGYDVHVYDDEQDMNFSFSELYPNTVRAHHTHAPRRKTTKKAGLGSLVNSYKKML